MDKSLTSLRIIISLLVVLLWVPLTAHAFTAVDLKDVTFTYKPDVELAFQGKHAYLLPSKRGGQQDQLKEYKTMYDNSQGPELDFTQWNAVNGLSPAIFRVRAHVKNYGDDLSTEVPITLEVMAEVGEYLVDQTTFMVDRQHLNDTTHWVTLTRLTQQIPPLAVGETYDFFTQPILFGEFLQTLQHEFPITVRVKVHLPKTNTQQTVTLPIKANHFALEDLRR